MFQEIVEQVEQAILSGELGPGDMLPPEMQMKEMFQTSRSTVREALRVLEAKSGLIEIRQGVGGGAVVKSIELDKLTDSLLLFMRSNHLSFDVVADFREVVEGAASARAARNAGPEGHPQAGGHSRTLAQGVGELPRRLDQSLQI